MRIAIYSIFALALLYSNVAVLLRTRAINRNGLELPLPAAIYHGLVMHGVFSSFEDRNGETTVWGLAENQTTKVAYWKQLPTEEFFPFPHGNRAKHIWARRQKTEYGIEGHAEVWNKLGQKIMTRYNAIYPSTQITKVAFQTVQWPSSPEGYYARYVEAAGKRDFWIVTGTTNDIKSFQQ